MMRTYCTFWRRYAAAALALVCVATGCWREVEYTGPKTVKTAEPMPSTTNQAEVEPEPAETPELASMAADASKAAATDFGADLAATLSSDEPSETEQTEPPVEPADTTPFADTTPPTETAPSSASIVGDRYATTIPAETPAEDATESPAAESDDSDLTALFGEPEESNTPPNSPVNDSMPAEEREAIAETSNAPIPNLDDDDIQTPPAVEAWTSRRAAWLLGSKLSLAALANEHGGAAEVVQKLFGQSVALAKKLGIGVKDLPPRPTGPTPPETDQAIDYLLTEGQEIGRELLTRLGADHASLFEAGVKSNVLLVVYRPGATVVPKIASSLEQASKTAELPPTLWQPLLDALATGKSVEEVRQAVYTMHEAVTKYLDEPPAQ